MYYTITGMLYAVNGPENGKSVVVHGSTINLSSSDVISTWAPSSGVNILNLIKSFVDHT